MNIYQCNICPKHFKTQDALNGHMKVHGPSKGAIISNVCSSLLTKQRVLVRLLNKHDQKFLYDNELANTCKYCNSLIKRKDKFCNSSCRASYTNKQRGPRTEETKKNISTSLTGRKYTDRRKTNKPQTVKIKKPRKKRVYPKKESVIVGPFCKLFTIKCAHCGIKFVNRRSVKYCDSHSHLYKSNNRNRYRFTFNIAKYPDIFGDVSHLIKQYGFWSPTNTKGLTRDHRFSVNESIKNNYDPYYITHPLNCEIMPWQENNVKNTKSSISYGELVKLVDEYNQRG
jgi:hypothetical protein